MLRNCLLPMAVLFSTVVWASDSYKPPEGGAWQKATVYLKATGRTGERLGTVVFACNLAETQHRAQLYAQGLRAGKRYTLWIVTMEDNKVKQAYQVTSKRRLLRADGRGVVTFIGNLPWCPVNKTAVVLKRHPDGRRDKFRDGVTVLKGYLVRME